ncbi:MAG: DUF4281 domain-containing protein [Chloroflexi bacterium]|nr:DUF4281 domain-containing protein [Chloroflexota bacterium]
MELLFSLLNLLVLPFWLLMIFLPRWRWTQRLMNSLWVAAPTAVLYTILIAPRLVELLLSLANPSLASMAELLGEPTGATIAWAHFLTFDLFVGRWAYLDGRQHNFSAWLMGPVLFFILMVGPIGYLLYLVVRTIALRRQSNSVIG